MELSFLQQRQELEAALEEEKSKVDTRNWCDVDCRTENSTFDIAKRVGACTKTKWQVNGDGRADRRESK